MACFLKLNRGLEFQFHEMASHLHRLIASQLHFIFDFRSGANHFLPIVTLRFSN